MRVDDIHTVCAVGTGAMGAGTALSVALSGRNVNLWGRTEEKSLREADTNINRALGDLVRHGLIDSAAVPGVWGRIHLTTDLAAAAKNADMAIESIVEDMGQKQNKFGELDAFSPPRTILASNTSSLSVTRIAENVSQERQPNCVAIHLFNPTHLMQLVEVVSGKHTSMQTMNLSYDLMREIGKKPVRLGAELPAYIVNRVQAAMWWAAHDLHEKGISAQRIDQAVQNTLGQSLKTVGILDTHAGHFTGPDAKIAEVIRSAMWFAAHEILERRYASAEDVNMGVKLTLGLRLPDTGPILSGDLTGLPVVKNILQTLEYTIPQPLAAAAAVMEREQELKVAAENRTVLGIYSGEPEFWSEIRGRRAAALVAHIVSDVGTGTHKQSVRPVKEVVVATGQPLGGMAYAAD